MTSITALTGRQILDSRGNPTVEAELHLSDGARGLASVPSGASTGIHESLELRDQDTDHYDGKGVLQAVRHVKDVIGPALRNNDPYDQFACDNEIVIRDGSDTLKNLGANATLSVSLALAKAAAASQRLPLHRYFSRLYTRLESLHHQDIRWSEHPERMPIPFFNVLNGGAHTNWQSTRFQEFMIVPHAAPTFAERLEQGVKVYYQLKALLKQKGYTTLVGDEGGFAPAVKHDQEAMELLLAAIDKAGYRAGKDISLALDPACSELYKDDQYQLSGNEKRTSSQMVQLWRDWIKQYPIMSLEDGLAEDDWAGWQELYQALADQIMLVGDDHLVTNPERIVLSQQRRTCNALLMKVNQIGTLTESLEAVFLSRQAGWKIVVSHRSGETEDTTIADLAVGLGAEYVKFGAPTRGERTAKFNQLLRIEEQLSTK